MRIIPLIIATAPIVANNSLGQNIPSGQCGLKYTYDNTGNILQREYVMYFRRRKDFG